MANSLENLSLGPDDKKKFDAFIAMCLNYYQQIDDLREGIKDHANALAEEYGLKKKTLTDAARTAYKSTLADKKENMSAVEEILTLTGHI